MTFRKTIVVVIILTMLGLAGSLLSAPYLPESVPSHWNAAGEADGYSSRTQALWFLPIFTLVLALVMLSVPKIDPLRKNIESFRASYYWMVVGMTLFMQYLHGLTLAAGLGIQFNMTTMMVPALAGLFVGIGFVVERAKPNWFIGIRTPWTMSNPIVWEKTHKLGGLTMKIGGLASLLGLFLPGEGGFMFTMAMILGGALIPVVYSYWVYQNEAKKKPD